MHARLIAGRLFNHHQVDTAPNVAIVDRALAARFWPGASAVGRRLYRPDDPNNLLAMTPTTQTFIVIGVIAPMKLEALVEKLDSAGAYYFPLAQQPDKDADVCGENRLRPHNGVTGGPSDDPVSRSRIADIRPAAHGALDDEVTGQPLEPAAHAAHLSARANCRGSSTDGPRQSFLRARFKTQ
jgi:hypothetical protein